jgi:molybdenum cofactor synthesis domain-containing protein
MQNVVAETAAVLLVGNELLSGKVAEANLVEIARLLRTLGIRLERALVLPDELRVLSHEVEEASRRYDVVFTSGGVGPTHDDVTIEAVARAFGTEPTLDPTFAALIEAAYGARVTPDHLRMALVPKGAELATSPDGAWPVPVMNNVWMLPGVPEVFREKLATVHAWVRGPAPFVSRAVYTRLEEARLKPMLDALVLGHAGVEIGSYPRWFEPDYKTKITFDARDEALVEAAASAFLALLPEGAFVRIE